MRPSPILAFLPQPGISICPSAPSAPQNFALDYARLSSYNCDTKGGTPMSLIGDDERPAVTAVAALVDCNPFVSERVELQRRVLGDAFVAVAPTWHADGEDTGFDPNLPPLRERVTQLTGELQRRLQLGCHASVEEIDLYRNLVLYLLWLRYEDAWWALFAHNTGTAYSPATFYPDFARDVKELLSPLPESKPATEHLFALGFQTRRAFHHIFRKIFGASPPAAHLRARVWRSIFSKDSRRYRAGLYNKMHDIPTLITGESGTGKELIARAIALSQYVPFDPRTRCFASNPTHSYCAVNLAAFSSSLIESELFGHRRGAFTGALEDREGWFQRCDPHGAVFLDEIGEIDTTIQVKLLRVLNNHEIQRIGDSATISFRGKIIAATNRNLHEEMSAGRFREDFFYRICGDLITTPTLRQQLAAQPDDLHNIIRIIARRVAGDAQADSLADEVHEWITTQLSPEYPWPGNMRELEQCVRNIMIADEYDHGPPVPPSFKPDAADRLADDLRHGTLTPDQLVDRYCLLIHAQTGNLSETARRLGWTRATTRSRLNAAAERQKRDPDYSD